MYGLVFPFVQHQFKLLLVVLCGNSFVRDHQILLPEDSNHAKHYNFYILSAALIIIPS